jgi:hypothetical protein
LDIIRLFGLSVNASDFLGVTLSGHFAHLPFGQGFERNRDVSTAIGEIAGNQKGAKPVSLSLGERSDFQS